MNNMFVNKLYYTLMIKLTKQIKNLNVTTDEGCDMKLSLAEGEIRRNIERQLQVWFEIGHWNNHVMIWALLLPDLVDHQKNLFVWQNNLVVQACGV